MQNLRQRAELLMRRVQHADDHHVFGSRSSTRELVQRVTRLPDEYMVRRVRDHWAIVGPSGLFVVGRADGDMTESAHRTAALAHSVRSLLSEEVSWVPFVDALLVAESEHNGLECTVVELDSLELTLTSGGEQIDPIGLHQIKRRLPGIVRQLDATPGRPLHAI